MKMVNELVAAGVVNPPCVRHAERHDIVDDLAMASSRPVWRTPSCAVKKVISAV